MKRRVDSAALNVGDFLLETHEGRVWRWPASWMSEKDWQGTVEDWALFGDRDAVFWHCRTGDDSRSKRGWFDLSIAQPNRKYGVLTELKVRDRKGDAGEVKADQQTFLYAFTLAGYNVALWTFPDEAFTAWTALTGRSWEECPYYAETKAVL